jgi:hypothetical protein
MFSQIVTLSFSKMLWNYSTAAVPKLWGTYLGKGMKI